MSAFDVVIKGGELVTDGSRFVADVGVRGEKIACIGEDLSGEQEIDASGCLVIPGGVDVHVHLQMPIGDIISADDWEAGTRAAAYGGTTTVIDFVDPLPGQGLMEALEARWAEAKGRAHIDYSFHMVLADTSPSRLAEMATIIEAGIPSFKLFMAYEGKYLTDDQLFVALREIARLGGLALVHAENYPIIRLLSRELLEEGKIEPRWHPVSRPAVAEGEAAGRIIALAEMAGAPIVIAHISCAPVVDQIITARGRGLPVFGETCPQYLTLTEKEYGRPGFLGARYVCSPPLRTEVDQRALWHGLRMGDLQILSTDHCPWRWEDKERGRNDFTRIPGGVPGIETRLALAYHFGVRTGRLSLHDWVNVCCTQPARIFGLRDKGTLHVGMDADIVVFDPQREISLTADQLHSQIDYSVYDEVTVRGWPRVVISRGQVVIDADGRCVGQPDHGRFIARTAPRLSSSLDRP
ncbi:MAG: dihydropyrimidinase [Anaerolineae bacterium]